ncbi:DUF1997 domain-containing protein [Okeania sp. SIO1I7]|uniref:DUF1997 domain-containing protein n=1 Tax=Okeania sp. SIO1I7 TaxID=2607772 RepID=UPI0013FACA4F|nr:DUF1997 domain-containing protein [Okeania sp. SIO1I7]NET28224.1 DUF1997 domain-containing protein [Okeania sp. SIO1I7]
MYNNFFASQSVNIPVPEQSISIHSYLSQPQRIVEVLADPNCIDKLTNDTYRLKMKPLKFFMLKIEPIIDMKIVTTSEGVVKLKSVGCKLKGIEMINEHFQLNLNGTMQPTKIHKKTILEGKVELALQIFLPAPFNKIPKSILLSTGNNLLGSILLKMKKGLMNKLLLDYSNWANSEERNLLAA